MGAWSRSSSPRLVRTLYRLSACAQQVAKNGTPMKRDKLVLAEMSDAEEAAIQVGIARDPENPELTDEQLASLRPAKDVLAHAVYDALVKRSRGRPRSDPATKKVLVKLRIDPHVLEAFKAAGPGWQTRMNDALKHAAPVREANPKT